MTTDDAETLDLFCWNLWFAGRKVEDGVAKIARIVTEHDAQIVCLQESGDAPAHVAAEAGLTVAQQDIDTAVLSHAPITLLATRTAPYATAARVESSIGPVLVWSVHLEHTDYGPYRQDELPTALDEVLAQPGERLRLEQAEAVLAETRRLRAELGELPVVVAGDFNVPSGQDWDGTFRPAVEWPPTQLFLDAGYVDAFRTVHPDVADAPGLTWSHIEPREREPRDRIDFVFLLGLEPVLADHYGAAADDVDTRHDRGFVSHPGTCRHIPDQFANDFPSDHLAVRVTMRATQSPER